MAADNAATQDGGVMEAGAAKVDREDATGATGQEPDRIEAVKEIEAGEGHLQADDLTQASANSRETIVGRASPKRSLATTVPLDGTCLRTTGILGAVIQVVRNLHPLSSSHQVRRKGSGTEPHLSRQVNLYLRKTAPMGCRFSFEVVR